jgi:hypothetical protein
MKNVKNIVCNKVNLPKRGLGNKTQVNRKAIIEHVKKGGDYNVPFIATFTDGTIYDGVFKIKKMFKEDTKDIIIVEEENLGQFGVLYDSFINGNFKGEFNSAWERMENNREYLRGDLNRKNDDYIEQKNLHTYYKGNFKEEKKAHNETKNTLVATQNELAVITEKYNKLEQRGILLDKGHELELSEIPFIVDSVIRMYERGTSRDTIVNKIMRKLKR